MLAHPTYFFQNLLRFALRRRWMKQRGKNHHANLHRAGNMIVSANTSQTLGDFIIYFFLALRRQTVFKKKRRVISDPPLPYSINLYYQCFPSNLFLLSFYQWSLLSVPAQKCMKRSMWGLQKGASFLSPLTLPNQHLLSMFPDIDFFSLFMMSKQHRCPCASIIQSLI